MAKVKKEELKSLKAIVDKVNTLQVQIGGVEIQKHELLHAIDLAGKELKEIQEELQKKYGEVSIDLETGEIKENEPNKED